MAEAKQRELMRLRDALTEALVGLIRTGGTGSFQRISDKDRVFFRGLCALGDAGAEAEGLEEALEAVRLMRRRLTAPRCAGCEGAPDLSGEFSVSSWEEEEREVRALKFLLLSGLCALAPPVRDALERGVHDPGLCESFYRILFALGEDFAEEDLLQLAFQLDSVRSRCRSAAE